MSMTWKYKTRALIFGHEATLLTSRMWLLRTIGCEAFVTTNLADFRANILLEGPDLIILCQTTSSAECTAATGFAAEHLPDVQMLIMFSRQGGCVLDREHVLLDSTAGPEAFMRTTSQLLTRQPQHVVYAN